MVDAWRALAYSGRLTPGTVAAGIIDSGFKDDRADWPPVSYMNNMYAIGAPILDIPDLYEESRWHGSWVTSAGFSLPDNSLGAAGPGGPVADLSLSFSFGDPVTIMLGVTTLSERVSVLTIAADLPMPAEISFLVLPFEAETWLASKKNAMIFASSGNDGDSVDEKRCIDLLVTDVCYEKVWHTPCENKGVYCVGATAWNADEKASYSNYGNKDVDLWAPGTVFMTEGDDFVDRSGTSFAAPFAAGVASLVLAADPSMTRGQIWSTLKETAHSSGDPLVRRKVNAFGAVSSVLGDTPPYIRILSPRGGTVSPGLVAVNTFVDDMEDIHCCTVHWHSDIDGSLSMIGDQVYIPSTGTHTLSAYTYDSAGNMTVDSVVIDVVDTGPRVDILIPTPASDGVFHAVDTMEYAFYGQAHSSTSIDVPCGDLTWESSNPDDTFVVDRGCEVFAKFRGGVGIDRTVTLTATSSSGTIGTDTIVVRVEPQPDEPVVSIVKPLPGFYYDPESVIAVRGDFADGDDGVWEYEWTLIESTGEIHTAGGHTEDGEPFDEWDYAYLPGFLMPELCNRPLIVELRAWDSEGNMGMDSITIYTSYNDGCIT